MTPKTPDEIREAIELLTWVHEFGCGNVVSKAYLYALAWSVGHVVDPAAGDLLGAYFADLRRLYARYGPAMVNECDEPIIRTGANAPK